MNFIEHTASAASALITKVSGIRGFLPGLLGEPCRDQRHAADQSPGVG
jgi:hypothetical protein